jgi:hypothetical protein
MYSEHPSFFVPNICHFLFRTSCIFPFRTSVIFCSEQPALFVPNILYFSFRTSQQFPFRTPGKMILCSIVDSEHPTNNRMSGRGGTKRDKPVSRRTDRSVSNLAASSLISSRLLFVLKKKPSFISSFCVQHLLYVHFKCFFKC